MTLVNKPDIARSVALSYGALFGFVIALTVVFVGASIFTPLGVGGFVVSLALAFVTAIIGLLLRSLHRTRYVVTERALIIETTKLIGGSKKIRLEDVKSVEKTMIPFGIKLFGASFHGGYYHIPNLGRAFLAITNFKDGLLIRTSQHNYIITPSNPKKFMDLLEQSGG